MLRDAAIALIKARCKRDQDTGLDATILTEMQYVQDQILEAGPIYPWFMETATNPTSFRMAAEDSSIALPSDFVTELEEGIPRFWTTAAYDAGDLSDPTLLVKDTEQQINAQIDTLSGSPNSYFVRNMTMYPRPIPTVAIAIEFPYIAKQTTLATNIENSWLKYAADLVIAETGRIISGLYLRDKDLVAMFDGLKSEASDRLWKRHEVLKNSNMQSAMAYG